MFFLADIVVANVVVVADVVFVVVADVVFVVVFADVVAYVVFFCIC